MKKKVIFFGSHEIAIPLLQFLTNNDLIDLVGIISQSDKPSGRRKIVRPTIVSEFAKQNNISLLCPEVPDGGTVNWMKNLGCEIIFVMAYGHILKKNILDFPPLGIYNFHASILPKYRGASPIESAIANGEITTGVSLMQIVEAMDAGGVADIETVNIEKNDNCGDVIKKISNATPILLKRSLNKICENSLKLFPQNSEGVTFTRKLSKQDGVLDFSKPANFLHDRIRALSPHIGGFCDFEGVMLKIGRSEYEAKNVSESRSDRLQHGQITEILPDCIKISTGDGSLLIYELQRPGGKMLPIREFINGFNMQVGQVFRSHANEDMVFRFPIENE